MFTSTGRGQALRLEDRRYVDPEARQQIRALERVCHEHGKIVMDLGIELGHFVRPRQLGTLVASDSGVWLERDPDTVREPDIAFTSAEKIGLAERVTGYANRHPGAMAWRLLPPLAAP